MHVQRNIKFGQGLFYDAPKYLSIVSSHSFWEVFSLGHFPIHPIFMGIFWLTNKFLPVNVTAMLFGVISVLLVNKISKLIFKKDGRFLPAIIFALFPGVWLINTNLMVESVAQTFFLFSIYLFLLKKPFGFLLSVFLLIGVHLESVFWIPAIFLFPAIFNLSFGKKDYLKFGKKAVVALLAAILFYFLLYLS